MEIHSIKRIDDKFEIIDQTLLPDIEKYILIESYKEMIEAIKHLRIRGAPAIGIAAISAAFLACQKNTPSIVPIDNKDFMLSVITEIENSRPTAVNLFHGTKAVRKVLETDPAKWLQSISSLVDEQMKYEFEACEAMSQNGFDFIPKFINKFLTHCNTGSLATYGAGTALGVIKKISQNREIEVYVDETRPLLQGARLTMWELKKSNINSFLLTDNMAAWTIKTKNIQAIITGADRIAKNGDTANKIGTFNLAILAKFFNIPFYIVAPESTIDSQINSGLEMIIEERESREISHFRGNAIAPENVQVFNPAFDITPAELITAIITEKDIYEY